MSRLRAFHLAAVINSSLAALAASNGALCSVLIASRSKKAHSNGANRRIRKPKFLRRALISPTRVRNPTPWQQLLACGGVSDFVVAVNFPKDLIISRLLPIFAHEQSKLNFGSPYRIGPKVRGRKCTITLLIFLGWYYGTSRPALLNICLLQYLG